MDPDNKSSGNTEARGRTEPSGATLSDAQDQDQARIESWRAVHQSQHSPTQLNQALHRHYQDLQASQPVAQFRWVGWGAGVVATGLVVFMLTGPMQQWLVQPESEDVVATTGSLQPTTAQARGLDLALVTHGINELQGRMNSPSTLISARYRPDFSGFNRPSLPALANVTRAADMSAKFIRSNEAGGEARPGQPEVRTN